MADDKLIEAVAKALRLHPAIEREAALAALAAIQQYGIVFFKYETAADGTVALKHIDWKDVYEPPAAALVGKP